MSTIFISYAEENKELVNQIAELLKKAGYSTWSYERHQIAGVEFIEQIPQAIAEADAMILIISAQAMGSPHVEAELFQAHKQQKKIIPLLVGVKYDEVEKKKPGWAFMLGPKIAIDISPASVAKVMPKVIKSLEGKGVHSKRWSRRWPRIISTLIVFIVCIAVIAGAVVFLNYVKPVKFADPTLESTIAESLNVPIGKVRQANLNGLSYITADSEDISNLAGIEHCSNLQTLQLSHCQISDISPLSGLTKLTDLELEVNQINDISALSDLASLQTIKLNGNSISEIYVLSGLTNLQTLHLEYNQISDISALVNNPGLSSGDTIYLGDNPLNSESISTYIPQLKARGVTVLY